mgnify:CR=1 FL=1
MEIEPYGGYIEDSNPLVREEIEYHIAGFSGDKLILYKSKQTLGYNNGTPDKVETFGKPNMLGLRLTFNETSGNSNNGRNGEVKIMPETASARAIERLGELNFTIELKEVGQNKTAYELTADKEGKFLGVFKVKGKVSVQVDAETGEVIKVHRPWWGFLAGI